MLRPSYRNTSGQTSDLDVSTKVINVLDTNSEYVIFVLLKEPCRLK